MAQISVKSRYSRPGKPLFQPLCFPDIDRCHVSHVKSTGGCDPSVSLSRSDIATPEDDGESAGAADAVEGFEGFDGLLASHLPVVRQWLVIINEDPRFIDHKPVDSIEV